MEDAHTILLEAPDDKKLAFFGVFDGHGGARVANFASEHLHKQITSQSAYEEGDIQTAIERGFLSLDRIMQQDVRIYESMAGSTAVVVLIKDKTLYCGNAGDSRAMAFIADQAVPLSTDHKPTNPEERARINNAGFQVEFNRVNGNLAVSRGFGDFMFKSNLRLPAVDQAVTSFPDITIDRITRDWKFILLACDGIWDVMTTQEVGIFVMSRIHSGLRPEDIVEDLLDACLSPDGQMGGIGSDNMTVVLIVFIKHMQPSYREYLSTVKCSVPRHKRSRSHSKSDDEGEISNRLYGIDLK